MSSQHPDNSARPPSLRQRAEHIVDASEADIAAMSVKEMQRVFHELQIHQVELEMQNEELREAQYALAEARDRYVDLYDFAPVGYISLNTAGEIVEANLAAAKLLGVNRSELPETNINRFLQSDCQDDAWRHLRNVFGSDSKQVIELNMHSADGSPLVVRMESIAAGPEDNRHCRTALIDITAVKRARELQESERRYRELNNTLESRVVEQTKEVHLLAEAMSSLGEGVMITGDSLEWPNPRIVYVNRAMFDITGYSAEEMIGQTPRMLQGELTDAGVLEGLRNALINGGSHRCELINYRKDGTSYYAEVFVSPLFDAEGQHTNFICIHRDITVRKRAEAALLKSEVQTKAILASLPAHIVMIDRTGTVVAVNPAWEEFAINDNGISVSCIVGANYLQVCRDACGSFSDNGQAVADGLQAILDGRSHEFTIEYPCHSPTEKRWFLLQATSLRHESGGAVVSHTNITARVQAEMQLRNNEERQRAILSTASDAIVIIDSMGVINDANPSTETMFGYDRDELIGQNVSLLMPSPYQEEHDGYLAHYQETGEARIIGIGREVMGQRKDGLVFPVDLAVSRVDHMGLFTGAIRDLSERRNVENELRREQELTANILNTSQNIVLLLDPQGCIVQFNPYTAALTGWPLDEVRGKNWFDVFLRASDRQDIQAVFDSAIQGQSTLGNVSIILTKDGCEREIEWYDVRLFDADGNLIGLLCTGQDVTENRMLARHVLKAATEEQRRIGQDLHDSVGQEVVGLTMMADSLTRSMKQNLASLNAQGIDVPGQPRHIQIAEQLAKGLQNALQQLKAVARGLHPVEVDPRGLHSSLHELAAHVESLYDITCDFDGDKRISITDRDTATHLYRIAQEACTNAVIHGKAGHVTLSLHRSDDAIVLNILDDGTGFPAHAETGEGLGLRSMRYRAQLIGGRLTIAPGEDCGTLVACRFPEA